MLRARTMRSKSSRSILVIDGEWFVLRGFRRPSRRPVASHVTLIPDSIVGWDMVSVASRQPVGWASAHQDHRPATTGQAVRLAPSGKRWAKAHPTAAAGLGIGDIATLVGWASATKATGRRRRVRLLAWLRAAGGGLKPTLQLRPGVASVTSRQLVGWASAHQDHRAAMMGQAARLAPSGRRWAKAHPTAAAGRGIGDIARTRRVGFSPPRPPAGDDGSGCSLGSERQRVGFSPPILREGRNERRLLTKVAVSHRATCPVASH